MEREQMMTRPEWLLSLLRAQPHTFKELEDLTGLSETVVRNALDELRRSGYVQAVPMTFMVTPKAEEGGKPKIEWRKRSSVRKPKPRKEPTHMTEESGTKISRILAAYQSGEPLTYVDVEAITGLDLDLIKNSGRRLVRYGLLEHVGSAVEDRRIVRLKLTPAGRGRTRMQDEDEYRPLMDAETTVKTAKSSRPALEKFWTVAA
jgi:DNA-binding MarR family transcriptional regulator